MNLHPRANWYRDLWLFLVSLVVVLALLKIGSVVNQIQASRQNAAGDSCQLLRQLILSAGASNGHPAQAAAFARRNDLYDCGKYVRDHVGLRR